MYWLVIWIPVRSLVRELASCLTRFAFFFSLRRYDHHHDYFDPNLYKNDPSTLEVIGNGRRNRLATVFWYLSDVETGGETAFPRYGGAHPASMQDCQSGMSIHPDKGRVIIFYSLLANGKPDPLSLHGACPVKEGVKWAANKWVWNEPMEYVVSMEERDEKMSRP